MDLPRDSLVQIDQQIEHLVSSVQADENVPPAFLDAVKEFDRSAKNAVGSIEGGEHAKVQQAVSQVEQAAEALLAAAEAHPDVRPETRQTILDVQSTVRELNERLGVRE
jgi:hypothetical protein